MPVTTRSAALAKDHDEKDPVPAIATSEDETKRAMPVASTTTPGAFLVPELLDRILLRLDVKSLLLAQRINRTFRDHITTNPALQRALFLLPERIPDPYDPSSVQLNPLLREKFEPWFSDVEITARTLAGLESTNRADAYMRRDASWRRMLVTQPPVRRMWVKYMHEHDGMGGGHLYDAYVPRSHEVLDEDVPGVPKPAQTPNNKVTAEGNDEQEQEVGEVRMGTLYDIAEEFIGKDPMHFTIHVTWCMFQEPRFRTGRYEDDDNTLIVFALDDAPYQMIRKPGYPLKPSKRPMADAEAAEDWVRRYRSQGFEKVKMCWTGIRLSCARGRTRGHART